MSRARPIVLDSSEDELPDLKDITSFRKRRVKYSSSISTPTSTADRSAAVPPRSTIRRIKLGSKYRDNPLLRPLESTYSPRSPNKYSAGRKHGEAQITALSPKIELRTRPTKQTDPQVDHDDLSETDSVQEQTITENFSDDGDDGSDYLNDLDMELEDDSFDFGGFVPRSPTKPRGKQDHGTVPTTSQRRQRSPSPNAQLFAEALEAEERGELPDMWPTYGKADRIKDRIVPKTNVRNERSGSVDFQTPFIKSQEPSHMDPLYKPFYKSTHKSPFDAFSRVVTPPLPSKHPALASPSKKIDRIPAPPHNAQMDNFWDQEFIDEWNDEHSPKKKWFLPSTTVKNTSKSSQSPAKKAEPSKAAIQKAARKVFTESKHDMAVQFFRELDASITKGVIADLAAETGGIRIEWATKLNTTAGRANWKRETIKQKNSEGETVSTRYKHHAFIELSTKVIDDSNRLLNVIAHEFCHLANFMISGVTKNPHGKEFKMWAAKVTRQFGHRGIEVTTRHSYDIDFKYVWECTVCGQEYKRHSRSINLERHRCGKCKAELKQTKPVPRSKPGTESEYQRFMKEQMKIIKTENPRVPQRDIMKMVASRWSQKQKRKKSKLFEEQDGSVMPTPSQGATARGEVVEVTDDLDDLSIIDLS